jgi:UDP-N-acetylglucosamine 2-epimerase (non-hydrolysing)
VDIGTNILVGDNYNLLVKSLGDLISGNWKKGTTPILWDGKTSTRIINHLLEIFS